MTEKSLLIALMRRCVEHAGHNCGDYECFSPAEQASMKIFVDTLEQFDQRSSDPTRDHRTDAINRLAEAIEELDVVEAINRLRNTILAAAMPESTVGRGA